MEKNICTVWFFVGIIERAMMGHFLVFKKMEGEAFNCMGNLIRFKLIKFIFILTCSQILLHLVRFHSSSLTEQYSVVVSDYNKFIMKIR